MGRLGGRRYFFKGGWEVRNGGKGNGGGQKEIEVVLHVGHFVLEKA